MLKATQIAKTYIDLRDQRAPSAVVRLAEQFLIQSLSPLQGAALEIVVALEETSSRQLRAAMHIPPNHANALLTTPVKYGLIVRRIGPGQGYLWTSYLAEGKSVAVSGGFCHSYDQRGFGTLSEMLRDTEEWLALVASGYGANDDDEGPFFPHDFEMWERSDGGSRLRLISVAKAKEAECGIEEGAWAVTLDAYADPSNARFGEWEAARCGASRQVQEG